MLLASCDLFMAEVILLFSVAHFLESHGMSYNAQLVTPALRDTERESERERCMDNFEYTERPLYILLPLKGISLMI